MDALLKKNKKDLIQEIEALKSRLTEAEEKLRVSRAKSARRDRGNRKQAEAVAITGSDRPEEEIREREQRFRLAARAANMGVYSRNFQTGENYWSPEFLKIFGLGPEEQLQLEEGIPAIVHPEDRQRVLTEAQARFDRKTEPEFSSEHRIILPTGEIRWVMIRGRLEFDSKGRPLRSHGFVMDATERKQAEELLRERALRLRAVIENSHDAIIVTDPSGEGAIVSVNPAAQRMFGRTEYEMIELKREDIFNTSDPSFKSLTEERVRSGVARSVLSCKRKDGTTFYGEVASAVFTEKGKDYAVSIIRDITERKQMEKALQQSERRFRALTEKSAEYLIIVAADGTILYDKPNDPDPLGYPPEETIGTSVFELITPEDRSQAKATFAKLLQQPEATQQLDLRVQARDGSLHILEVAGTNLLNDPAVGGVVLNARDVTERKRAEEELRMSEERFRALVTASSEVLYSMSSDWSEMCRLHSRGFLSNMEKPSRTWLQEYIHPDDQPHVTAVINEAIRTKSIFELEHRVLRADGSLGWTFSRAVPLMDGNGQILEWFGSATDITHRKQAEDALRLSEEKFAKAFAANPAAIALTRIEDGLIMEVNETWQKMFEYSRDEVIGRSKMRLNIWPSPEARALFIKELQEKRSFRNWEQTLLRRSGATFVALTSAEILNAGGEEVALSMWVDINDRKRTEEALRKAHDELELRVQERTAELDMANLALRGYASELERLNKELEEFAWITAHDLQEPLRKIQTYGSRLQPMMDVLSEQGQSYLQRMIKSANRMAALILDLKSYSKLSQERHSFAPFDLKIIVEEAISDLEVIIHETQARVELFDLPFLELNRTGMRQLFQNLISNSIKYAKENEKPVVKITGFVDKGICQIHVEDNGIGFEEKYLNQIFKPFQRLHGRSSKYEGTGIGLAICRKVVEIHGGEITARSEPGRGSVFIISLPLKQEKEL